MSEPKDILLDSSRRSPGERPSGVNHLLVIAIDAYKHCPPLHNCVKDAMDFIQVLWEKYTFEKSHTYTLINEQATRSNILNTIRDLKDKVKPKDNLLIYFSGHGQNIGNVGYWIPVEVHSSDDSGFVSTHDLKARLDNVHSFHTLLVVDACFSGSLFLSFKSAPLAAGEDRRSRWGLAASHSREQALDGTPGENSPFADRLLKNLRINQGKLGMQDLAIRIKNEVFTVSEGRQTPIFQPLNISGDDSGQFVFHPKTEDEETVWATVLQQGSIESLDTYLIKFPNGLHAPQAQALRRDLEEESRWENLKTNGTVAQCTSFLLDFPNSRFHKEVRLRIRILEETQAWEEALRRNGISDFFDFIDKFPQSQFAALASQKIAALRHSTEEEDAWRQAKNEHSEMGYQRYISRFPQGRYAVKASEELEAFRYKKQQHALREKEEIAWSSARRTGTIAAFEAFLRDYPTGSFHAEATGLLDSLKSQAAQQADQIAWNQACTQYHRLLRILPCCALYPASRRGKGGFGKACTSKRRGCLADRQKGKYSRSLPCLPGCRIYALPIRSGTGAHSPYR